MPTAKLKSLTIEKYPGVEPTALRFHPKRNIFLGKNGSGKTSLLKLISMLLRWDFADIAQAEFSLQCEIVRNDLLYRITLSNVRQDSVNPLLIAGTAPVSNLLATGTIEVFSDDGQLFAKFANDGQATLFVGGTAKIANGISAERLSQVSRGNALSREFPIHLLFIGDSLQKGIVALDLTCFRFDEGLQFFDFIFSGEESRPAFLLVKDRAIPADVFSLPRSAAILDTITKSAIGSQSARWTRAELPFLNRLCEQMGFAKAEYMLELKERRASNILGDTTEVVFGNFQARFYWPGDDFVSHEHLSYGQKRLLALTHYLAMTPDWVIADEIVNGLHHDWISFCLNEIGDRQAFLTSQNPLLFDYIDFDSADEVQEQFVLCSASNGTSRPRLKWTQLTPEKAKMFFRAYESGMQYVGEILQSEGLW